MGGTDRAVNEVINPGGSGRVGDVLALADFPSAPTPGSQKF